MTASVDPSIPAVLVKDLQIDGEPVPTDVTIISAFISLGAGSHDQVDLTIKTGTSDYGNWSSSPISFQFGQRLLETTFNGYVKSAAPSAASPMATGSGSVTVSALGVSYKMRQGRPRFWSNVLVSDAIADIVAGYQLGVIKEQNDSFQWQAQSQTTDSDWAAILALARYNGYLVLVTDGVVRVCDPQRLLRTSGYAIQVSQMTSATDTAHNLYEWTSTYDVDTLTNNTFVPVFSFLTKSDEVQYSESLGVGKYLYTEYPVRSLEMANAIHDGIMVMTDNWACTGAARIRGNAAMLPGDVVTVRLSPTTTIVNKDDGPWLVIAVQHTLDSNSFQTMLLLKRQEQWVGEDPNVGSWRPYFAGDTRGAPKLMLLQGDWVSTWREVRRP